MSSLKPNLIFDVGLHLGEDTDYYLKKGFDIVAFEADAGHVAKCRARFSDAIAAGRLVLVEGAIAPASFGDTVTFYRNLVKSDWGTIDGAWASRNDRAGRGSEKVQLPRVDIAEAFQSFGIPHYLKIDIEGVDRHVFEQLKSFADRPRYVSMESEQSDLAQLRADMTFLRELGYTKFAPVQQASIPGSEVTVSTLQGSTLRHVFDKHASGPFGEDLGEVWLTSDAALRAYEDISDQSALRQRLLDRVDAEAGCSPGQEGLPHRHRPPRPVARMVRSARRTLKFCSGFVRFAAAAAAR